MFVLYVIINGYTWREREKNGRDHVIKVQIIGWWRQSLSLVSIWHIHIFVDDVQRGWLSGVGGMRACSNLQGRGPSTLGRLLSLSQLTCHTLASTAYASGHLGPSASNYFRYWLLKWSTWQILPFSRILFCICYWLLTSSYNFEAYEYKTMSFKAQMWRKDSEQKMTCDHMLHNLLWKDTPLWWKYVGACHKTARFLWDKEFFGPKVGRTLEKGKHLQDRG